MKVAVLFSGGKDSTYAAYLAKQSGHDLQCLVTANPYSAESKLLSSSKHTSYIDCLKSFRIHQLLSQVMEIICPILLSMSGRVNLQCLLDPRVVFFVHQISLHPLCVLWQPRVCLACLYHIRIYGMAPL